MISYHLCFACDAQIELQQWSLFDKQFGRTDADEPDPEGRVPLWDKASVQEMKDKFKYVGFGPRQVSISVLIASLLSL